MKEIERKYLVDGEPWKNYKGVKVSVIRQGYISKTVKHTVRIRIVNDKKAFITIKGPTKGFTRDEFEYSIPYEEGIQLLGMCDGLLVEKTRRTFKDENKQKWELDVFTGNCDDLTVAEIELVSEDVEVILPPWIVKEVTFDKRYTNAYLCSHGIPVDEA